jgi:DNA-binding NarL/FixJ family response regulator
VAVVDDDPALHAQVREQLQHSGAPWHMTSYHNGAEAMKGVVAAPPQVVLLDIGMPEMNGIECAHQLAQRIPALPVVMHTRRAQPEMVVSALRAGARGYVVKTAPLNGLVPLLNKAMTGGLALCANGERLLMEAMHRTFPAAPEWGLTQREEAVLFCLCRHLSDKEMASALAISEETVHVHLRHAFKKLGIHNRQAAIRVFTKKWSGGGGKLAGRGFCGVTLFNPSAFLLDKNARGLMGAK